MDFNDLEVQKQVLARKVLGHLEKAPHVAIGLLENSRNAHLWIDALGKDVDTLTLQVRKQLDLAKEQTDLALREQLELLAGKNGASVCLKGMKKGFETVFPVHQAVVRILSQNLRH